MSAGTRKLRGGGALLELGEVLHGLQPPAAGGRAGPKRWRELVRLGAGRFLVWDFDGTLALRPGNWTGVLCEVVAAE
jgi:hypothetical protein